MKILLVTIHNSGNYGGALQAFATLKYLEGRGHSVDIADYQNRHIMKGLWPVRIGVTGYDVKCMAHDICHLRERLGKRKRFLGFYRGFFHYTSPFHGGGQAVLHKGYDLYISGSDQIWNPAVTNGFPDPVYFLRTAPVGARKASLSSSLGDYDFSNAEYNSRMREWLKDYQYVSVRERASLLPLKQHCGIDAKHTLDPVFLLDEGEWGKYADEGDVRKPYLLVYPMKNTRKMMEKGRMLAQRWGIQALCIGDCSGIRDRSYIEDAGPAQFLGLIKGAEFVLTNSFHATAFSVLFRKPFFCVTDAHNPGRLRDFLELLHLERHGGGLEDCLGRVEESMDFAGAEAALEAHRDKLRSYVSGILGGDGDG